MPPAPRPNFKSKRTIPGIAVCLLFSALPLAAQNAQAFRGVIADSMCAAAGGHTAMLTKGQTAASCAASCVKMGARYVLASSTSKAVYELDDQTKPKAFAARNVVVVGTLDKASGTIHVADMIAGLPPKVIAAKSVFIDCDDCLRAMAKAKKAALEEVTAWKRFRVATDNQKTDLIFLFSANPYLGDYNRRGAPDTRVVRVKTTFMNVIDPRTGESLWDDSRKWGSFRVAGATKELVEEFRAHLQAEQGQVDLLLQKDQHQHPTLPQDGGK